MVSPAGAVIASRRVPATPIRYLSGYRFAVEQAPGSRVWAIEGTGSSSASLARSPSTFEITFLDPGLQAYAFTFG